MSQFGVLVQIAVEPGKFEELREIFAGYYPLTLQEKGLERGHVMIDKDDPSKVFVFEVWKSQKDFEKHLATAHAQKFAQDTQGTYGPDGFVKTLVPFI